MMADKFQWATAEHLDRMDTIGARSFEREEQEAIKLTYLTVCSPTYNQTKNLARNKESMALIP